MNNRVPWTERARKSRAIADVLLGCYPRFVFGGGLSSSILPVFHLHSVTPAYFRPFLEYLTANGYRTLGVDDFLGIVSKRASIPPNSILLTFDDAWASVWTVAAPLLREFGFRAITFAIPGRVSMVEGLRTEADPSADFTGIDSGQEPFARWDELRALDREGIVEVEAHTFAHAQVPIGPQPFGHWTAKGIEETPLLSRPIVIENGRVRPIDEREAGTLRWRTRPRMSDVRAWLPSEGRAEGPEEARHAIRSDLEACYDRMEREFEKPPRVLCFPWTVAGSTARNEAKEVGFESAFSDFFPGRRFVRPGDDPFRLMRLKHEWILRLPGRK